VPACLAAGVLTLAVAACGAQPPQAPLADAQKLDVATSGISTACGKADLLTAFGGVDAPGLRALDATATASVDKLALVYHRNPAWIYQGSTIRTIVADSVSMLGSCGLHGARARLLRQTGGG
jgi:hypothetical protein